MTLVALAKQELRLAKAVEIAKVVRAELLSYEETPRNLEGQCGLTAMLVASALDDPHVLRTGFYMKRETFLGVPGRYPNRHAWCRVETMIVDATATQFHRSNKAVHVARFDEDTRYIETSCGADALDDIMDNWKGCGLLAYKQLAKKLRRRLA